GSALGARVLLDLYGKGGRCHRNTWACAAPLCRERALPRLPPARRRSPAGVPNGNSRRRLGHRSLGHILGHGRIGSARAIGGGSIPGRGGLRPGLRRSWIGSTVAVAWAPVPGRGG